MFYADSLGFLGKRGGPIVVENGLKLNLVHLTAVPPWVNTMKETLVEIEKFKEMIFKQPRLMLVKNQKDLSSAIAGDKIAVVLGMQNTPDDILKSSGLTQLMETGIRIISPCYGKQNGLGSGWLNADFEMTWSGELFLTECCRDGIIVDLSHCGHKMTRSIISYIKSGGVNKNLEFFKKMKLMASHGGCYSQYHHFRNLPDDVLKEIAELGGTVGISTLTFTNDERDNSLFPFKDHLLRAIALCGANSVCIGSDDLYITRDVDESKKQFEIMSEKLDKDGTQGARFPENPIEVMGPDMLEKLYKFCQPYLPEKTLENVFGQNLFNFFERSLPA